MSKLSIIIPVYNTEKYLKECLESVVGQTLDDFEIIIVDDGSQDNSLKICQEYGLKDNKIKIISQQNQGQGVARNKGLEIATGEYVGFIDSDDTIEPEYFEYLYKKAKKNEADIVSAKILYAYDNTTVEGDWLKYARENQEILTTPEEKLKMVYVNCSASPCKHIYKNSFLKKHNISFAENTFHEDQFFNTKAFLFANKIVCGDYNSPNYFYKVRSGSSMHQDKQSAKYTKVIFDQIVIFNKILKLLKDNNVSSEIVEYFKKDFETIALNTIEELDETHFNNYVFEILKILDNKKFIQTIKKIQIARELKIEKDIKKLFKRINVIKDILRSWR